MTDVCDRCVGLTDEQLRAARGWPKRVGGLEMAANGSIVPHLELTPREREVLRALVMAYPHAARFQDLVSGYEHGGYDLIRVNVSRLRPKLPPGHRIGVVKGLGYRLVVEGEPG